MHAGIVGHMLAQVVHRDVHQLHRVQRRAAKLGRRSGMGGAAGEGEVDAGIGQRHRLEHAGHVGGVPADRGIDIGKEPGADHEGFRGAALFRRAAVIAHTARRAGFRQPVAQRHRRQHRGRAQQVVPAAMPGIPQRARLCHPRLLPQRGKRVILAQDGDQRAALPPFAHQRSRNPGEVAGDARARRLQRLQMRLGRGIFVIGHLGRVEDPVGQRHELGPVRLDQIPDPVAVLHDDPLHCIVPAHPDSRRPDIPAPCRNVSGKPMFPACSLPQSLWTVPGRPA
ncbi:hypothetical protein FALB51S_01804 [Frigidibacter albus]